MTANKIGIFGGSFNPVHKGHILVAEKFIKELGLDLLYIIPNHISPFKDLENVSGEDRIEMLKIAFSGNSKIAIGDMELKRGGRSYTCDTVEEIKKLHPHSQLFLLIGDDLAEGFTRWKNAKFILENVNLVIATRNCENLLPLAENIKGFAQTSVDFLHNEAFECSSSSFRRNPDHSSLPQGVYEYIKKRGLYGL
ncbi:MAG: nicotinate (nicotinamide) nucleotide adenylyltransferase [Ruminococcaceae bacterium]|nr:nicotinate (nicotinamide) nucleotide adenylyltransferase [Oscillospiraceae bacterium]